jgi:hypothetical protein
MSSVLLDDFKANKIYETLSMLLVSPPFDEDMLTFKVGLRFSWRLSDNSHKIENKIIDILPLGACILVYHHIAHRGAGVHRQGSVTTTRRRNTIPTPRYILVFWDEPDTAILLV